MRRKRPQDSFRYACEGILHCFRTQRHMRFHFVMLVLVLASGLLLALDTLQMLILMFCISLVMATEMVNTAVEALVDMVTPSYDPLAKLAKDVAAGAVLIASLNAFIAGILIFFGSEPIRTIRHGVQIPVRTPDVTVVLVVGVLVVALAVITSKLFVGRGNDALMRGGVVSGHSAIGFFLAMTIIFTTGNRFVAVLALLMAALIAQSRVEARIHSVQEVVLGAVVAIFLTSAVYWLMPRMGAFLQERSAPRAAAPGAIERTPLGRQNATSFGRRGRA